METKALLTGENKWSFLCKQKAALPTLSPISEMTNVEEILKIVGGFEPNCLIWRRGNRLEFHQSTKTPTKYQIPKENIKNVYSGYYTYLILTESGKVFSLANKNQYSEIPLSDPNLSTFEKIRPVSYFENKNIFVESIAMSSITNYYICRGNKLYGNGYNQEGRLGNGKSQNEQVPIFLRDGVDRAFGGPHGMCFFYTTTSDKLYSAGYNSYGICGTGTNQQQKTPVQVPNWKSSDILDIKTGSSHTALISTSGKVYTCGSNGFTGTGQESMVFKQVTSLSNKKVIELSLGTNRTFVRTDENEIYAWGVQSYKPNSNTLNYLHPQKIVLPEYFLKSNCSLNNLKIDSACEATFIYFGATKSSLLSDFKILFESKKYCDSKIGLNDSELPIHKLLVELRTGLKVEKIQKILEESNFSKEELNLFLQWVYNDQIGNGKTLDEIFQALGLSINKNERTLKIDLFKLYKDEDSKDFNVLVRDDDEDEDDDVEDEDDEAFEEIPVHKFILCARSGLFREMFDNVNEKENSKSVKDFSGKTVESLEILFKYFYTDKIELTADDDPQLVVEELSDAVEYYQLNENSNLNSELLKIKKQFNIN
ncbi:btk-binding protein-related [Anaeramoeba flamelloides]|uniref:Btk-binding protein-related n=1 Tax=Anaeramoeba flamelloides TaxID=1746091 RepID=A0AAV7ZYD6_9EUKA|nr:btk-binding protein-related [Anaeramoeba flamelloides]